MIRLSKLTDYGFVLLTRFACSDGESWLTARDLSDSTGLPLPTVSKLLKLFSKNGLLTAQRGVYGGYRLAHDPSSITVAEVIELVDGPIAITECACEGDDSVACAIEAHCPTRPHWLQITKMIKDALSGVTLLEISTPVVDITEADSNHLRAAEVCGGSCAPQPGQPCQCGHDEADFSGEG